MPTPASSPVQRSSRAVIALVGVTVAWGWTFVWMKQALGAVQQVLGERGGLAGIATFLVLRFGLAAVLMLGLPQVRHGLRAGTWVGGLWIGMALLAGFQLQMLGLGGVSPAVSAFLTSLYVLFTATFSSLRARKAPHRALLLGALLATFGAGFIGGPPQLTFDRPEWLTVGCALVFAVHILITDAWTKREAAMPITFTSFVVVAIGSVVTLAVLGTLDLGVSWGRIAELLRRADFLAPLLLSSLLATVVALSLMNAFQRQLDPVRAAILYAIEPVWTALIGIALGVEKPSGWLLLGGVALLAGNLIAELGPVFFGRKPRLPRFLVP